MASDADKTAQRDTNKKYENLIYDSKTMINNAIIIDAKKVVDYDLENGGLYQITFMKENNGYFTLCRDFDEEDENIYFENDDQCNAVYVFPEDVKYNLENGTIEFVFNENIACNVNFGNFIFIKFPTVSQKQFAIIKQTLENIWGKQTCNEK